MIKTETHKFNQEVRNMVKLWDQKISNLRGELNIHGIYRKMSKLAEKEELEEDMKQIDKKNNKIEGQIYQLKAQLNGVGNTNQEIEDKINYIYDRQKEVVIGKRNVNCLSCAEEPENRTMQGTDGKIYRGTSPPINEQDKIMQKRSPRVLSEDKGNKNKHLLNMKWDNIGLKQTQYSNTFNLHKLQGESGGLLRTGSKTERGSQLFEVLTEEDP